ncbi:polyprenyl synthetase family protein [Stieleria marina]|uniref:All-trans-nonaprenyl-diphosphate synthase (Geranyl-diphosphate specific) n=1 Tax=Stieleria marina TaxID=1930275 RepID=A0A517NT61_9BACT|nr:All-trans-nonaprenyl-diphosphate synthase (geranyl-diphosphate specific) [Planctomycetes bacterium K23_9]
MDSTSTMRTEATSRNNVNNGHRACESIASDAHPIAANRIAANPNAANMAQPQDASQAVLEHLYGPIAQALGEIEKQLNEQLQSPYESLVPLLRHGTQLGGKRLRPAMLLLAATAVGQVNQTHVVLGTVIEMVHTATLIHDDVLDEATTRRHVPTINALHDNHTSILLGDFLFAQAFRLTATLDDVQACRWIGDAAKNVCVGELRQVLDRDTIDLDEETYLDILRGKTAELCSVACRMGARHAGGSDEVVDALAEFGNSIGIAFQIADDYLDLWGDDQTVGKTLGTDLEQGKMTLPLIRLLDTCSDEDRDEIVSIITGPSEQRIEKIRPWLDRCDAKQYTSDTATRFQATAVSALDVLQDSAAKECLRAIAKFAVDRRF